MRKLLSKTFSVLALLLVPVVSHAARLQDFISRSQDLITEKLIPIAYALCLLYFFWGVAKYIRSSAGSEKAAAEGKRIMVWGIVGLFVAFSVWGIVTWLRGEVKLPPINNVQIANPR